MDATQYSYGRLELSSCSSKGSIIASTLVAVRVVHSTADLSQGVLDVCASLLHATIRSILIGSTYAVRMEYTRLTNFSCTNLL